MTITPTAQRRVTLPPAIYKQAAARAEFMEITLDMYLGKLVVDDFVSAKLARTEMYACTKDAHPYGTVTGG
jgi:hypothetical protein